MRSCVAVLAGWALVGLAFPAGCARRDRSGANPSDAGPPLDAAPSSLPTALDPGSLPSAAVDAGPAYCRTLFGPKQLPVYSPASLFVRGDTLDVTLNEDGKPHYVPLAAGPVTATATGAKEALASPAATGLTVGCAVAGDAVYCPDRGGNVHRTPRGGGEDHLAASARVGSRIAAGTLDGTHAAFTYLASRQTSEGWVTEAWLGVDDVPPVRVSEDGSGATAITVAQHGSALLLLSVDARSALTAMHARVVTFKDGLHLGEDSVLFVGGPGEKRTGPAIALGPTGAGLGLLPIAKDVGDFGLALVRIDEPPHVDEPVSWSMYPNGIDPAPVAAAMALRSSGAVVTWVARVRPVTAVPGSERVLELGEVAGGSLEYVPREVIAGTSGIIKDASMVVDAHGALWLAWVDGVGTWVERLACK